MAIRRTVLNWQKGFNRFWLLITAVVVFGGFIAITVNPHNESLPESLQEISVFVTALFNLVMSAFVSVLFFVLGSGVHVVILWNDLWCESAALREKDSSAMANKIYRGFRLILLGVGSLVIIGCTRTDQSVSPESPELEKIAYPGAPIISIQKTSVAWEVRDSTTHDASGNLVKETFKDAALIRYLLEAQEPLPYDIEVDLNIKLSGTDVLEDDFDTEMQAGRTVRGTGVSRDGKYDTATLSILPWDRRGDAPYNIGSPKSFTVKRGQ